MSLDDKNIVIVGHWDGDPIWRYKTAEERLEDAGIRPDQALLYIILQENYAKNNQREN